MCTCVEGPHFPIMMMPLCPLITVESLGSREWLSSYCRWQIQDTCLYLIPRSCPFSRPRGDSVKVTLWGIQLCGWKGERHFQQRASSEVQETELIRSFPPPPPQSQDYSYHHPALITASMFGVQTDSCYLLALLFIGKQEGEGCQPLACHQPASLSQWDLPCGLADRDPSKLSGLGRWEEKESLMGAGACLLVPSVRHLWA